MWAGPPAQAAGGMGASGRGGGWRGGASRARRGRSLCRVLRVGGGVLGAGWCGRGLQRAPRAGAGRVGGASRYSGASGAAAAAAATTKTTGVGLRAEGRHGHDCGAAAGRRGRGGGRPWLGERRVRVAGPELRPRGARRAKRARAGGGQGLWAEGGSTPGSPGT